jgi:hypothetical protein
MTLFKWRLVLPADHSFGSPLLTLGSLMPCISAERSWSQLETLQAGHNSSWPKLLGRGLRKNSRRLSVLIQVGWVLGEVHLLVAKLAISCTMSLEHLEPAQWLGFLSMFCWNSIYSTMDFGPGIWISMDFTWLCPGSGSGGGGWKEGTVGNECGCDGRPRDFWWLTGVEYRT